MNSSKFYIESSKSSRDKTGNCIISEIKLASDQEIKSFKSLSCNHRSTDLLIYDKPGYMYDTRHCGVCNEIIGFI